MEMSVGQERKSVICKEKKCTTGEIQKQADATQTTWSCANIYKTKNMY